MNEPPYVSSINLTTIYRNLIIAGIFIGISLLVFCLTWLQSPFLVVKTSRGDLITHNPFVFFYRMILTCWETDDQEFWLRRTSLEGYTYILFLKMKMKMIFYYLVIVYGFLGFLELWYLFLEHYYKDPQSRIYYRESLMDSHLHVFLMVSLLTVLLVYSLMKFQRRIRFHFIYFNLWFDGKDQGLLYLNRRTVILKAKNILHEPEESLLQFINDYLENAQSTGRAVKL